MMNPVIPFEGNLHVFGIPKTWRSKSATGRCRLRGSSLHNPGERGEDSTDFTGMFEPVAIVFAVAVVAHHMQSS